MVAIKIRARSPKTWSIFHHSTMLHARIQRGDRGSRPPPLKNHKNIGFLSNTEKSQSYTASSIWVIIGPPAKHHLNDIVVFGSSHQLNKKNIVKAGPLSFDKIFGSAHVLNPCKFSSNLSTSIPHKKASHQHGC